MVMKTRRLLITAALAGGLCASSITAQSGGAGGGSGAGASSAARGAGAAGSSSASSPTGKAAGAAAGQSSAPGTVPVGTAAPAPTNPGTINPPAVDAAAARARATSEPSATLPATAAPSAPSGPVSSGPAAAADGSASPVQSGSTSKGPVGAPDMSPTSPSRLRLDRVGQPGNEAGAAAGRPPAISAVPPQPGISPLSGLPTAALPPTSPGTAPIDSRGGKPSPGQTGVSESSRTDRPPIVPAGAESLSGIASPISAGRHSGAQTIQVVPTPPPAPQPEAIPESPSSEMAWVPGHHTWSDNRWTWIEGSWQRPPTHGSTWTAGTYDPDTRRWISGHWSVGAASEASPRKQGQRKSQAPNGP